jgi:hypothetical protein
VAIPYELSKRPNRKREESELRRMVAGAKKGHRKERQRISAWPGGRAQFLVVVLTLVLVVIGLWVLAMVLL